MSQFANNGLMQEQAVLTQYFKRRGERKNINRRHQHQIRANSNSNIADNLNIVGGGVCRNNSGEISSSSNASSNRIRFCEDMNIIIGVARHSQFATLDARHKTFNTWTKSTVCARKLAEAGFINTNNRDIVECFQCGGILCDWPDYADPWHQHALAFPNCAHVRRSKGEEYITNVQRQSNFTDPIVNNSGYSVVDAINLSREDLIGATAVQESASDLDMNTSCVKNLTLEKCTVESLTRTLETLNSKSNKPNSETTNDCESDSDDNDLGDIDDLEEENRRLKEPLTCKICMDAVACIVTLPCGHMVSCFQCIPALTTCAVCRTPIKGTVRARMAVNYLNENNISDNVR